MILSEFGKWLMDIAKYLATAVLISALFRDIHEISVIVMVGLPSIALILGVGLLLLKLSKKQDTGKRKNKKKIWKQ
jgi:hypothetical protein